MSTEVILMEDVDGLGFTGDLVKVSEGYARNFLLPRHLAAPVTEATRRRVEKRKVEAEAKRAAARAGAEAVVARIQALTLKLPVRVGAEGKLFGSVTAIDIAAALKAQGIAVEKQQIELPVPIKALGPAKVVVKVMANLHADLKVEVVAE